MEPTVHPPSSNEGIYELADADVPPLDVSEAPTPLASAAVPSTQFQPQAQPRPSSPQEPAKTKAKWSWKGKGKGKDKGKDKETGTAQATQATVAKQAVEDHAKADPSPPAERERKPREFKLRPTRKVERARWELPAWGASFLMHLGILGSLAAAGMATPAVRDQLVRSIDAAPIDTKVSAKQAEELLHFDTDPSDAPRDQAVSAIETTVAGSGSGTGSGSGGGSSATGGVGLSAVGAGTGQGKAGIAGLKPIAGLSGLALMPSAPTRDLGGGGMIAGDVTYETKDIGDALSQLAREILRHLAQHKLIVVWLFDESYSMRDDQRAVKDKFDRVVADLKVGGATEPRKKGKKNAIPPLAHVVVGFGETIHFELEKPTADVASVGVAIDRLHVDETGVENTLQAIEVVINRYNKFIDSDRKLLIVLATDESGDDGSHIEEARQLAVSRGVPIYVLGRQSMFGYPFARMRYVDPITKDVYWPQIRRGPETADLESLQWDGYHERWDETPAGFAPYELARLAKETGGIYFLIPSVETQRNKQNERAYSMATLKEYVPDYENRLTYFERRNNSELRRTLYEIVSQTKKNENFSLRQDFPVYPEQAAAPIAEWIEKSTAQFTSLLLVENRLRQLAKARAHETEKRWQAHYDLITAQILVREIKIYEYRACLIELAKNPPKPSEFPRPDLDVYWRMDHSKERVAPKNETEKKYAEAERLLKEVIARHPDSPWADLAQEEINRGFGTKRYEIKHKPNSPQYNERAKLVPHY